VVAVGENEDAEAQRQALAAALQWAAQLRPRAPRLLLQRPRQTLQAAADDELGPLLAQFDAAAADGAQARAPSARPLARAWGRAVETAVGRLCGAGLRALAYPAPELWESEPVDILWNNALTLAQLRAALASCAVDVAGWESLVRQFEGRWLAADDWAALETRLTALGRALHAALVSAGSSTNDVRGSVTGDDEHAFLSRLRSRVGCARAAAAEQRFAFVPWHGFFLELAGHALSCLALLFPRPTLGLPPTPPQSPIAAGGVIELAANPADALSSSVQRKKVKRAIEEQAPVVAPLPLPTPVPKPVLTPERRPSSNSSSKRQGRKRASLSPLSVLQEAMREERRHGQEFAKKMKQELDDEGMVDLDAFLK
jgi:hypothetical protein